jgi:hypothetical protein
MWVRWRARRQAALANTGPEPDWELAGEHGWVLPPLRDDEPGGGTGETGGTGSVAPASASPEGPGAGPSHGTLAPVPPAEPAAAAPDVQVELVRVLDAMTRMCDHVVEYIEADRAERRLMLEALGKLVGFIGEPRLADEATAPAAAPPAAERVLGGSMPAGPEPVIDLREPVLDPAAPEPTAEPGEPPPRFWSGALHGPAAPQA